VRGLVAGLIGLTAADIDVQDALGAIRWAYEGEWRPRPVVRLTTSIPVAVNASEGRTVVRARWGFDIGGGRPIGNARDDKLLSSRMWTPVPGFGILMYVRLKSCGMRM
jgi:putative SOS response-associated peptidase YedK